MQTILALPAAKRRSRTELNLGRPLPLTMILLFTFLLFVYSGSLLRRLDPTAAVADLGVLSLLLLALLGVLSFIAVSLWLLGLLCPAFNNYRKHHFVKDYQVLPPALKILFYMAAFFLLLFAFIFCLMAVM